MTTMKRIDLIQTGSFQAGTHLVTSIVDIPIPSKDQVLIDIKASAVNPVDWKMAEYGFLLPTEISREHPVALGCDIAGVVTAPESSPLLGKRVVMYLGADKTNDADNRGAFVEHVVADADLVFEIPDAMTFAEASTMPVAGLTAGLLMDAIAPSSKTGEYVLIWGTSSSVGFFALQLAKAFGYKVIAVASSKHKDMAMKLGAVAFVDYRTQNVKDVVTEIVRAAPDNTPLNGAMDCIGNEDTLSVCADLLDKLGSVPEGTNKIVGSVSPIGPDPPAGVEVKGVNLGTAVEEKRGFIQTTFPTLLPLQMQPVRSIRGPVDAKTVEEGFQTNKNGVSGEKVVLEWTK